jgi:hypothetical protein
MNMARSTRPSSSETAQGCLGLTGCGCITAIIIFNLLLGPICFDYSLDSFFAKDAPWYLDLLGGLVFGEVVIPLAILCFILRACGVQVPFIH